MFEFLANAAKQCPANFVIELHQMGFLVRGFRNVNGKVLRVQKLVSYDDVRLSNGMTLELTLHKAINVLSELA